MQLVLTISPFVARRQSVPFLTLSQLNLTVPFTTTRGRYPQKILPSVLDYVEKSARGLPFSPAAQPAKNVGFTIRCEECQNQAWCIRISNHREHIEG